LGKCFACGNDQGKPRPDCEVEVCDACWAEHLWRNEAQVERGRAAVAELRKEKALTPISSLLDLRPGEEIKVQWAKRETGLGSECYGDGGKVLQVTAKFVAIRHPFGFTFTVAAGDLACGTKILAEREIAAIAPEGVNTIKPVREEENNVGNQALESFTAEQYIARKEQGQTDAKIRAELGVQSVVFAEWKRKNNLEQYSLKPRKKVRDADNQEPEPAAAAAGGGR